jgi:hypothetical protein
MQQESDQVGFALWAIGDARIAATSFAPVSLGAHGSSTKARAESRHSGEPGGEESRGPGNLSRGKGFDH